MHAAHTLRLVYFGSPGFAVPGLRALLDAGYEISLVVTQPDRPAGRGRRLTPTPVASLAEERALPTWKVSSLAGPEAESRLRQAEADAMVLSAFAAYVPRNLLNVAPHGILNVHPSLLPRWRGASPIQAALLAGDSATGVSIIRLVEALDAGPIYLQERIAIGPEDDYLSLEPRLAALGAQMLPRVLQGILEETLEAREQDERFATECARIDREDARINWSVPADLIWRQVRAFRGWPRAYTTWDGKLLKVLRAHPVAPASAFGPSATATPLSAPAPAVASPGLVVRLGSDALGVHTGDSILVLDEVVPTGRSPMSGGELARGYPGIVGTCLGSDDLPTTTP